MENEIIELTEILNWSNELIKDLRNHLDFVRNIKSFQSQDDIDSVFHSFSVLLSKIPVNSKNYDCGFLLRCRPNIDDKSFTKESELSYNKGFKHLIKLGRFNREEESMFYCSVPNGSEFSNPSITSSLESYKDFVNDESKFNSKVFTFSTWKVEKPFNLVDLTFYQEENNPFRLQVEESFRNVNTISSKEVSGIVIGFWELISHISFLPSESDFEYIMSNLLFGSIRHCEYKHSMKFSGLRYPSSITDRLGTNAVLFPEVVDECLKIDRVVEYRYQRCPHDNKSFDIFPICHIENVEDSSFKLKRWNEETIKFVNDIGNQLLLAKYPKTNLGI